MNLSVPKIIYRSIKYEADDRCDRLIGAIAQCKNQGIHRIEVNSAGPMLVTVGFSFCDKHYKIWKKQLEDLP